MCAPIGRRGRRRGRWFVVREIHEIVGAYAVQEPPPRVFTERLPRHEHPDARVRAEWGLHDASGSHQRRGRGRAGVVELVGIVAVAVAAEDLADEVAASHARPVARLERGPRRTPPREQLHRADDRYIDSNEADFDTFGRLDSVRFGLVRCGPWKKCDSAPLQIASARTVQTAAKSSFCQAVASNAAVTTPLPGPVRAAKPTRLEPTLDGRSPNRDKASRSPRSRPPRRPSTKPKTLARSFTKARTRWPPLSSPGRPRRRPSPARGVRITDASPRFDRGASSRCPRAPTPTPTR